MAFVLLARLCQREVVMVYLSAGLRRLKWKSRNASGWRPMPRSIRSGWVPIVKRLKFIGDLLHDPKKHLRILVVDSLADLVRQLQLVVELAVELDDLRETAAIRSER